MSIFSYNNRQYDLTPFREQVNDVSISIVKMVEYFYE